MPADPSNPENWSGKNKLAVVIETAAFVNEVARFSCATFFSVDALGSGSPSFSRLASRSSVVKETRLHSIRPSSVQLLLSCPKRAIFWRHPLFFISL